MQGGVDKFEKTATAGREPDRYSWSAIEQREAEFSGGQTWIRKSGPELVVAKIKAVVAADRVAQTWRGRPGRDPDRSPACPHDVGTYRSSIGFRLLAAIEFSCQIFLVDGR